MVHKDYSSGQNDCKKVTVQVTVSDFQFLGILYKEPLRCPVGYDIKNLQYSYLSPDFSCFSYLWLWSAESLACVLVWGGEGGFR